MRTVIIVGTSVHFDARTVSIVKSRVYVQGRGGAQTSTLNRYNIIRGVRIQGQGVVGTGKKSMVYVQTPLKNKTNTSKTAFKPNIRHSVPF